MDTQDLNALIARMNLDTPRGRLCPRTAYEALIGDSLEVVTESIAAVITACTAAGQTTPETARVLGDVRVYAPRSPALSPALVLETPDINFLQVLSYEQDKPGALSPELAAFYKHLGRLEERQRQAAAEADRPPKPPRLTQVSVSRFWPVFPGYGELPADLDGCARVSAHRLRHANSYQPNLTEARANIASDRAVSELLFAVRPSRGGPSAHAPDARWREGMRRVQDFDAFQTYFPALARAIVSVGEAPALMDRAAAFAARDYETDGAYPETAAARAFGARLAREDGFLPDARSQVWMDHLNARAGACEMADAVADLEAALAACRAAGHVDSDSEAEFGDADYYAFAPDSGVPGLDLLCLRDQSTRHLVAVRRDAAGTIREIAVHRYGRPLTEWFDDTFATGITMEALEYGDSCDRAANPHATPRLCEYEEALAHAVAGGDAPSLNARFAVTPSGLQATGGRWTDRDAVTGFQRCLLNIHGAACALDDTDTDDDEAEATPGQRR